MPMQRVKTLTFDADRLGGMTVDEVESIARAMKEDGIPGSSIFRVETSGQRGNMKIVSLTASDRPETDED